MRRRFFSFVVFYDHVFIESWKNTIGRFSLPLSLITHFTISKHTSFSQTVFYTLKFSFSSKKAKFSFFFVFASLQDFPYFCCCPFFITGCILTQFCGIHPVCLLYHLTHHQNCILTLSTETAIMAWTFLIAVWRKMLLCVWKRECVIRSHKIIWKLKVCHKTSNK